jgi:hypothetical protein
MITDNIDSRFHGRPQHRAQSIPLGTLRQIERFVKDGTKNTLETGCGASTIILAAYSRSHVVFAYDDREHDGSSVLLAQNFPGFNAANVRWVFGPTQKTLPTWNFEAPLDFALLDGPHGYPFPDLEYFFIYPHLRQGSGVLGIDDIQIPTIHRLYEFLLADDMFELVALCGTMVFFRRTEARTFNPFGDGWWEQKFNRSARNKRAADHAYEIALAASKGNLGSAQLAANLGVAAVNLGHFEEAKAESSRAVELAPACTDALVGLTKVHIAEDDLPSAVAAGRRAVCSEKENGTARLELATAYLLGRQIQEAINELQELLRISPASVIANQSLSLAYAVAGDMEMATKYWAVTEPQITFTSFAPYKLGTVIQFNTGGNSSPHLGRGWYPSEQWGRWTRGVLSELQFLLEEPPTDSVLMINGYHALSHRWPIAPLSFRMNGTAIGKVILDYQDGKKKWEARVRIPASVFAASGQNRLVVTNERPISPGAFGRSTDKRMVGLHIARMAIVKEADEQAL